MTTDAESLVSLVSSANKHTQSGISNSNGYIMTVTFGYVLATFEEVIDDNIDK